MENKEFVAHVFALLAPTQNQSFDIFTTNPTLVISYSVSSPPAQNQSFRIFSTSPKPVIPEHEAKRFGAPQNRVAILWGDFGVPAKLRSSFVGLRGVSGISRSLRLQNHVVQDPCQKQEHGDYEDFADEFVSPQHNHF